MGLIEASSNKSFWRGVDYYEHNKVLSWGKSEDGKYYGCVQGSHREKYEVSIDVEHPRKSKCTCPFATDRQVVCKHMLALYFTAEPKVLEGYLEMLDRLEREQEEEEERLSIQHEQELMRKAKQMSKTDLIEELVLAWLRIEEMERNSYYY